MFDKHPLIHDLKIIASAIEAYGGDSRLVGGSVRDVLCQKDVEDFDIATTLHPEKTLSALKKAKIKSIPTGIKYGTVSALINKKTYEITTLRRDIETDGRKATVEYTDNWHEDAARRDFTINAMSYDLSTSKIYDYYNGQQDLREGIVKFVGNPEERVKEDYLRIIRFYRFQGKYGRNIDDASINACRKFAEKINSLSGERRHSELKKIILSGSWYRSISLMQQDKILPYLIGDDIHLDSMKILEVIHRFDNEIDFALLIYILVRDDYKATSSHLKLSNKEDKFLKQLNKMSSEYSDYSKSEKKIIYKYGHKLFFSFTKFILAKNNKLHLYEKIEDLYSDWQAPIFPIKGTDIKDKFNISGKEIGKILKKAEEIWLENNMSISREEILNSITSSH